MEPHVRKSFNSITDILYQLSTFPKKWKKYDCSIEYFGSQKNFCKIYTKKGMFNYIVVNQDVVINTTLVEKFKLWKVIRRMKWKMSK